MKLLTPPSTVGELEELLSRPTPYLIEALRNLHGDILVLGAGGKMGPSLAVMARRASDMAGVKRRVMAASRFGAQGTRDYLIQAGVEVFPCDLLDDHGLAALPDAENIVFMAGMKFGASEQTAMTWAMNVWLPGLVCRRYPTSRMAVFSTGNIYGLTPLSHDGSKEEDLPNPQGEYAMSTLGRERMFEYFSRTQGMPQSVIRLNYACDLRYGVLVDIALKVLEERPVSLAMACLNTIWQGDANAMALASLAYAETPPLILNITGPRVLRVREIAERFGRRFGKTPVFMDEEGTDALLSDSGRARSLFGPTQVDEDLLMDWVADWLLHDGPLLNKPTHFESRDGRF